MPSFRSPSPNVSRFSVRNVSFSGGVANRSTSDFGSAILAFASDALL